MVEQKRLFGYLLSLVQKCAKESFAVEVCVEEKSLSSLISTNRPFHGQFGV